MMTYEKCQVDQDNLETTYSRKNIFIHSIVKYLQAYSREPANRRPSVVQICKTLIKFNRQVLTTNSLPSYTWCIVA